MKRRITLSIALVVSFVLVSLTSSDSTVTAQNQIKIVADTDVITLGQNQILRVMAVGDLTSFDRVRFRKMEYMQGVCGGGVCKLAIASQTLSDIIILMPGEAASFDIPNTAFGVRAVIESPDQNMRVSALIINTTTGDVVSYIDLNDPR